MVFIQSVAWTVATMAEQKPKPEMLHARKVMNNLYYLICLEIFQRLPFEQLTGNHTDLA